MKLPILLKGPSTKLHRTYAGVPIVWRVVILVLLLFAFTGRGMAQNIQAVDTTVVEADSAGIITPANQDSIIQANGHAPAQSGAAKGKLKEGEVRFQSKDSLVFDFKKERVVYLYGSGKVKHQSGTLEAGKVTLNLDENLVEASTDTPGDTLSEPVLKREGKPPVRSEHIAFNYKSKKGRFKLARVKIKQGQVIGTVVKNTSPHVIYLKDAKYSTCTLPHPHYYIKAQRMKIVKKNGKQQIFFQHAMLYLLDIPYPFVFPFGYVPGKIAHRQSGLLTPTYASQQKSTRGLGIRNLGWFQYFNDYLTGQISTDLYTSGSYYLNGQINYRKRGDFNGSVNIGYSHEQGLEPTDPSSQQSVAKNIQISHSQDFSPYSHISANIHLRTQNYYKRNSYDIDDRARTNTSSHINYSYRQPEGLFHFNASMQQNIDFQTDRTTIRGPSFNFNLKQLMPFKKGAGGGGGIGESKWYENVSINYQNSFQSNYNFSPRDSTNITWFHALLHPSKYRAATNNNKYIQFGFRQQASISAGNLLGNQFLNMSASINYTGYMFPSSIRKTFNADSSRIETRKVVGFTSARDFSAGINFSTTLYGISQTHIGHIIAFRHTMRPSISFNFSPDFSTPFWGYYQTVQTDTSGHSRKYSIFQNEIFSGPGRGGARSISFSLNNVLEAKKVSRDSTGEKHTKTLRLIDNLSMNTSYNLAADSLNLSNLHMSLTSSVVSGLSLRASANFNFYKRNANGRRINQLLLFHGGKLMELTNFSFSANTSFHGGNGRGVQLNKKPYFPAHYNPLNQSVYREMDPYFNMQPIQPIESPWSVSLNLRYSWRLNPNGKNQKSATINASNIHFNLTPKWSFSTRLGYDFIRHKFTPSSFNLSRKLHEWNLSFQFSPFGDFQYYFFSLSVNAGALQSIFQKLPLLKNLSRSSSPTGAGLGGGRYRGGGFGGRFR